MLFISRKAATAVNHAFSPEFRQSPLAVSISDQFIKQAEFYGRYLHPALTVDTLEQNDTGFVLTPSVEYVQPIAISPPSSADSKHKNKVRRSAPSVSLFGVAVSI